MTFRVFGAFAFSAALLGALWAGPALAERDYLTSEEWISTGPVKPTDPRFRMQEVAYQTSEQPGTVVIETRKRFLYLVMAQGKALRYGIGVGRRGFTWKGTEKVSRK